MQYLHVDVGGTVPKDEALVLYRVVGRIGRVRVVFVIGRLDEDGLEIFYL
jgi:hypothetical protein